jgi:hypothetical protein
MSRPTKLDFKPLTLVETAKALGVPPARARKILALVGVDSNGRTTANRRRSKAPTAKTSSRSARSAVR